MNFKVVSVLVSVIVGVLLVMASVLYLASGEEETKQPTPQPTTPVFDVIDEQDVGLVELIVMEPMVFNINPRRKTFVQ